MDPADVVPDDGASLPGREKVRSGGAARAGAADARPGPLESLVGRTAASFRRRMVAGTAIAVFALAGVSGYIAWRQYDQATGSALQGLQARAVSVGGILNVAFAGDIDLLETVAATPAVRSGDLPGMSGYFRRVQEGSGQAFTGGLTWIDLQGEVEARGTPLPAPVNVSGRLYFRSVLSTGKPYVSSGFVGKLTRKPLVVIAVPTVGSSGRLSGVLVGSILLPATHESPQALSLGFGGLEVVDADGRLLLSRLTPVANRSLLARMRRLGSGVIDETAGLDGRGSDAVAFAAAPVSGWLVVLVRSRSALFAPARQALILDLASAAAAVLLVLGLLAYLTRRARREAEVQDARARAWSGLTGSLAAASTPAEVADALLAALGNALPDSLAVVGFEREGRLEARAASPLSYGRRLVEDRALLHRIAVQGAEGKRSRLLEQTPELRLAYTLSGRRLRGLHALPVVSEGRRLGTIAILSVAPQIPVGEWALLESFADQAAAALGRARVFEREHELALRLQRNLLPDRLPSAEGVELAGHYHAGGAGVEVGGDWYDAARRPDGILQLCVGDVSGRGIGAATIMGKQRNVFRAYAYECTSPAEIIRRMLRHVDSDDMITIACVAIDLFTGELAYACAGHPPPLLLDRVSGEVRRLDQASAPPIGVAEPTDIVEATLALDGPVTLALYTDGLVERRGTSIDDGIDLLGVVLASGGDATPDHVLEQVSSAIGDPVDDVALLIVAFDSSLAPFELEVPAEPGSLPEIRRRLRAWLAREQIADHEAAEVVLAVSEACNNAIEHGYRDRGGGLRVSVARQGSLLRAAVEDRGSWREERPGDDRGRGMSLMRSLTDTFEVETGPHGTRVSFERRVRVARDAGLAASGV